MIIIIMKYLKEKFHFIKMFEKEKKKALKMMVCGLESFINDLIEIPNQSDLDFMNNKINTFMNELCKEMRT